MADIRTERQSRRAAGLDTWPAEDVVEALLDGQLAAAAAAHGTAAAMTAAVETVAARLAEGGRLAYVGAGTSGRLAVLDGVELVPTFGWPRDRLVYLLAGGDRAMFDAVEGAEDDAEDGRVRVGAAGLGPADVLIGVAASGHTPFTVAAVAAAREAGVLTVGICSDAASPLAAAADHPIVVDSGAELIAGSTRMRAGTAQKALLNTLSTGVMIRLGHVHDGYMIAVQPTNRKLRVRAAGIIAEIAGCDHAAAEAALAAAGGSVAAGVLIAAGAEPDRARRLLDDAGGHLRPALARLKGREQC